MSMYNTRGWYLQRALLDIFFPEQKAHLLQELQNGKHNVINVTKSAGLRFLGMVEATGPVDADVCKPMIKLDRTIYQR